jgi:hypothetical protein
MTPSQNTLKKPAKKLKKPSKNTVVEYVINSESPCPELQVKKTNIQAICSFLMKISKNRLLKKN